MAPDAPSAASSLAAASSPAPVSFSSPPPAFPPPDPAGSAAGRASKLLVLVGLAGLLIGIVMTILWLGARSDADAALVERDAVLVERDAATNARIAAETELTAATSSLATAEEELAAARAELAAAQESAASAEELDALTSQIADLEAEVATLSDENVRLQAELDAAIAAAESPVDETPVDETPVDGGDAPLVSAAEFDATTTPEFARYIGELLSSSRGSSQLGEAASICFGTEVINAIGVDAIGNGQNNAASGAERQIVIDAMVAAAGTCGIDQSLIF